MAKSAVKVTGKVTGAKSSTKESGGAKKPDGKKSDGKQATTGAKSTGAKSTGAKDKTGAKSKTGTKQAGTKQAGVGSRGGVAGVAKKAAITNGWFAPPPELVDLADPAGRPTRAERRAAGKELRDIAPLAAHGEWKPADDRPSPIDLLVEQGQARVSELVPIRYGRMMASPFAYYRGTPIVMAADLAGTPRSGLGVQACGDAHLVNFGLFATPERNLIFDVNDFDETLPGPWEWDVKRLAASVAVAGYENGLSRADCQAAAQATVESYVTWIGIYAQMGGLEVWYAKVDGAAIDAVMAAAGVDGLSGKVRKQVDASVEKAMHRNNVESLPKLTEVVDGRRRIIDDPPLITHVPQDSGDFSFLHAFQRYRSTLRPSVRMLLDRYAVADVARKVVGVGSVGTRCYVVLLVGADGTDPLFLQVKEAERSVLERHLPKSGYANSGERVVIGQRMMQAASDVFLGWTIGPEGRHFYIRQLRDMKGSARVDRMTTEAELAAYGGLCAWTLARGHARSGDHVAISGYLGKSDAFAEAVGRFSVAYADQNLRDHEDFVTAIKNGKIFATPGY